MFRKKPFNCTLAQGATLCTRSVSRTDEQLNVFRELVTAPASDFYKKLPHSPEDFSLKSRVESGVNLQEVDSVVFKSDSLSDIELNKINSVLDSSEPSKEEPVVEPVE